MSTIGHVYAILPREFSNAQEGVLKVGKSTCIDKRCLNYPKGSTLVYSRITTNCTLAEQAILQALQKKQNITHRKDIGREFFQGNLDDMIQVVEEALCTFKYNDILNNSLTDTVRINEKYVMQFYDERLCHMIKKSHIIPYADMLKQFISFTEEHPHKIKWSFDFFCESLKNIYNLEIFDNTGHKYFRFPCEKSPISDWLFANYHITQDQNDRVLASELYRLFIKATTGNVSVTIFGATIHKICGIQRKTIRMGNSTLAAYLGIKKKD